MTGHMVYAGHARNHVKQLVADGMRQHSIAGAGGVSPAALSILLHGHFTPGRPPQETIKAEVAARLMAVQFEAPEPRRGTAEARCTPGERFEPAGYNVGRCADCGELAPLRTAGYRKALVGHPTLDATAGGVS